MDYSAAQVTACHICISSLLCCIVHGKLQSLFPALVIIHYLYTLYVAVQPDYQVVVTRGR